MAAGQVTSDSNSLSGALQVRIGGTQASVGFAGLTQGNVGLYQINVVVPPLNVTGKAPLTFTLGGTAGTQSLTLAVQ